MSAGAAATSREPTGGIFTFAPSYLTTVGVDLRQRMLRGCAIAPACTALRIPAAARDGRGGKKARKTA